jgi:hypothetical protein
MKFYSPDRIEEYLGNITNRKDKMTDVIIKDHFLCKYLVEDEFHYLDDDGLKFVLKTFIKYGFIPNNDLELLMEEIRDSIFIEYKRITPWHISKINVLDASGEIIPYGYCKAYFNLSNKWGFQSRNYLHRIIYDSKTLTVVWADFGNYNNIDINEKLEDSENYISYKNKVYELRYIHTDFWLMKNPDLQGTILKCLDDNILDEYINNICKESIDRGHGFILDIENAKVADLADLLGKDFFKNGPKWKYGKNTINYNGIAATEIKEIVTEKNIFKIIIENNTFRKNKVKTIYMDIEEFVLYNENKKKILIEDYKLEI